MPSSTRPVELRCNHLTNPLGQHDTTPRLGWRLHAGDRRGARQTAYRLTVSTSRNGSADLWDSGWVKSDATSGIAYAGKALASRQRAWWRVEVRDESGHATASAPAFWEMGLLNPSDWSATWIGAELAGGPESSVPSPYLRTIFNAGTAIASARLFVTALGLYEFQINGRRVGTDELAPGWTDYAKRVQYQAHDVTALLQPGANAIGAILGDGWYSGRIGWRSRGYYGERPKLLAQLVITYRNGSEETIVTDGAWKTHFGAIVENDIMAGETHDARRELTGWSTPDYNDREWQAVMVAPAPAIALSPTIGPMVRATQEIKPVGTPRKMDAWPEPVWIFDLGQNLAGRIRLRVKGAAGQMLKIRYAEILNPADNQIYTDNLRAARCTDFYILRGDPAGETWEP
jgi:alpha-L-rhamnosidase